MRHTLGLLLFSALVSLPMCGQTATHRAHPSQKTVKTPDVKQQPSLKETSTFDFHGDALGESLADFKQKHSTGIDCSVVKTDLVDCSLNDPKPTVVGVPTNAVQFKFFEAKLFEINVFIINLNGGFFNGQPVYDLLNDAYTAKYGTPDKNEQESYHNGFGAVSYGQREEWMDLNRAYYLWVKKSPADGEFFSIIISFNDLASEGKQAPVPKSADL